MTERDDMAGLVEAWVARYLAAWDSNDPADVRALFLPDGRYRFHPWDEPVLRRLCGDLTRFADRYELAFVDGAAHFITDDAPGEVAALALDWMERAG